MYTGEIIDVYNRLNILHGDLKDKISILGTISDTQDNSLDVTVNGVFAVFIEWLSEYTEDIKFK